MKFNNGRVSLLDLARESHNPVPFVIPDHTPYSANPFGGFGCFISVELEGINWRRGPFDGDKKLGGHVLRRSNNQVVFGVLIDSLRGGMLSFLALKRLLLRWIQMLQKQKGRRMDQEGGGYGSF